MLMMINNFRIKLYRNYENKKIEKIFKKTKHESKDFLLHQRDWKNLNKTIVNCS